MISSIQFCLNDKLVTTNESPGLLVLDYLRRKKAFMGTKEGCKEGDCGACTVLIGELHGEQVRYQPVTSCLVPIGELHGKHLVTIEGFNMRELSPVQRAIVDEGGSQCGFCTPGIVVSLTWYLLDAAEKASADGVKRALSGHLCRCTGYSSLKRAGDILLQLDDIWTREDRIAALIEKKAIPAYFAEIPEKLRQIPALSYSPPLDKPDFFIAGGTDIYVQKGEDIPDSQVQVLNIYPEMKGISRDQGSIRVGALTTFEEFAQDEKILAAIPRIGEYMHLIASLQLRNRATLGGNVVNASPIGDMTILLLALDTQLVLRQQGQTRTVPMKKFFLGYKQLDKKPGEILSEMVFPIPCADTKIHFEKVSKRKCLDIASVNSAIKIRTTTTGLIEEAHVTMGGVAPVPLFMENTSKFLCGKEISMDMIAAACAIAQREISPISDIRGSADYKRLLVQQFLLAHFTEMYPEHVDVQRVFQ